MGSWMKSVYLGGVSATLENPCPGWGATLSGTPVHRDVQDGKSGLFLVVQLRFLIEIGLYDFDELLEQVFVFHGYELFRLVAGGFI